MKKKNQIFIICILLAAMLSGCNAVGETGVKDDDLYIQNYQVTLYYANAAYVESGDEDLPKMQKPLEVKIRSLPQDVYVDTVNYLKQEPTDEGYVTLVPESLTVNSVVLEEGTAIVDLDGKELSGGSMQETFTIAQIVNTLLSSFYEIDRVQFTVDGAPAETLMGHIMAIDPFYWQDL